MSWHELTAAADRIRDAAVEADPRLARLPLTGIGWATVEHERAIDELDLALGGGPPLAGGAPERWTPLARDPALGARAWLRMPVAGRLALVVLEPDTEGRIAASLARFGEGIAVVYLGADTVESGHLVRGGPAWGPHVVVTNAGPS
jgi:hypothetical protein